MIQLRKRFIFLTTLVSLSLFIFGTLAAQAQSNYWRFGTPLPTVTCTNSGGVFEIGYSSITLDYSFPTSLAAIISGYQSINGGAWTFIAADSFPTVSGSGTLVALPSTFPVSGFPATLGFRLDTSINGQGVYQSFLSLTCPGVGTGIASLRNSIVTNSASAIDDGRINAQNFAPVALYCDGSVLTAYIIDSTGQGTQAWSFDFSKASTASPLVDQLGITLSRRADGRYYVLAPQHDGKQYLYIFDGCPSPGATETYISDPVTGQFVRTE